MTMTAKVNATTFSMPSDHEITMTRVVAAPRRLVFEVHTNPKHVPQWMLGPAGWSMPVCEIDLRPGGMWRFVWRHADGSEMTIRGEYREIIPPERLVSTESWGGEWPEALNTLILTEADAKTTISQRIRYSSQQARDAALKSGMQDGISESFDRLAAYLATLA